MAPDAPALVPWPARSVERVEAAAGARPCLVVLGPGDRQPALGPHEDWIRAGASELDVAARLERLAAQAPIEGGPVAPAATVPAIASPTDHRLARLLLENPSRLVARDDLRTPDLDEAQLDRAMARVRRALAPAGWSVRRVADLGFLALPGAR